MITESRSPFYVNSFDSRFNDVVDRERAQRIVVVLVADIVAGDVIDIVFLISESIFFEVIITGNRTVRKRWGKRFQE